MNKKFTSTIAGASVFITLTGLISKGLGFIREVIFAGSFGLSAQFDVYLIGAVLPVTINTIILYLALNYLIPAYNNITQQEESIADDFIRMNFIVFTGGGMLLSLLLFLFSDIIIGFYLHTASPELFITAKNVFLIFLISIPLNSAIAVLTSQHQIHMQFAPPAYSNLLVNIVIIILVLLFAGKLSIYIIPVSFVAGSVIQLLYLLKTSRLKISFRHLAALKGKISRYIPSTLIFIMLIEGLGQLYILADRYFYSYVPQGGIAALNYANTVFLLPVSILSAALTTAVFPKFAQYIGEGLTDKLEELFNEGIKINFIMFVPVTIIFIFYGDSVIRLIFERGKFSAGDTRLTFNALAWYSVSLIFYSAYSIVNKIVYSFQLVKQLLYITAAGILIKIILNFLLAGKYAQDGLAFSTSVSYMFFFFACLLLVFRKVKFKKKALFFSELLLQSVNAGFSVIIAKLISGLFPSGHYSGWIEITLFLIVYIINIIMLKHTFIYFIKNLLKNELFRLF
jgi:putative peptidoglycan lipid II flippase